MKSFLYSFLLIGGVLLTSCEPVRELPVFLTNPLETSWEDAQIAIPRKFLEKRLGTVEPENLLVVSKDGKQIPSQMDDLDQDGKWDELAMVLDFGPSEALEVQIGVKPSAERALYPNKTNLHLGVNNNGSYEAVTAADRLASTDTERALSAFQFEGPGWENDQIAFRNYLDARNGIDIFGKLTNEMVLEGVGNTQRYDTLQSWGMDILKVGSSLGAGAIALQKDDKLYRVASTEAEAILVIEGPVRSVLKLSFPTMQVGDISYALSHDIHIWQGQKGYTGKVTVTPHSNDVHLVSGLVNMENDSMYLGATETVIYGYSHDPQTINGEYLGMGLLAAESDFKTTLKTTEEGEGIIQTDALVLFLKEDAATSYQFIAGWEKQDSLYSQREYFHSLLKKEAEKIGEIIEVSWK
ncbi:MAG: DUF4861 family protein [Bacteroidota bacterium]